MVSADASTHCLGAVLLQCHSNIFCPVVFDLQSFTLTEQRYPPPPKKESLALHCACEKFRGFPKGIHFKIQTNYKPLMSLLEIKIKNLCDLSPRIQRLRMHVIWYSYEIIHMYVAGKFLSTADMLCRESIDSISIVRNCFLYQIEKHV